MSTQASSNSSSQKIPESSNGKTAEGEDVRAYMMLRFTEQYDSQEMIEEARELLSKAGERFYILVNRAIEQKIPESSLESVDTDYPESLDNYSMQQLYTEAMQKVENVADMLEDDRFKNDFDPSGGHNLEDLKEMSPEQLVEYTDREYRDFITES